MLPLLLALALGDVSSAVGVNIHFTGAPARDLDMIRDAGFGWIRMDFVWGAVEREKGVYRFEPYDQLVEGLEARKIRALFILDYSNRLYEKERSVRTAEGREAFARFAGAAAARYRGRGVYWEIWNEPNLEGFWAPQPAAEDYAALAIDASQAIRAADPKATVVAPASSGFPWDFFETILEKGILDHIDAFSVHPYRGSAPETVREDYARLRELLARHARAGKPPPPIVSGEWGYSTWHHGGRPFSAEVQGAYLARQFLTNLSEGIPLSIWYDWANDGPDPKETEHNFGTVTLERDPKPAYVAAKTLTSTLAGTRFERRIEAGSDMHLLVFRGEERSVLAAWTSRGERRAFLEAPSVPGTLPRTLCFGEKDALEASDGSIRLLLDGEPQYVQLPSEVVEGLVAYGLEVEPHGRGVRFLAKHGGLEPKRVVLEAVAREVSASAEGKVPGSRGEISTELLLEPKAPLAVDVPIRWPPGRPVSVQGLLRDPETRAELAAVEPPPGPTYVNLGLDALLGGDVAATEHFEAVLDGDRAVVGEARVSSVALEGETDAPARRALRLEYRFAPGWRFVSVVSRKPLPIAGGRLVAWVRGDGSGNLLRCRFRDAEGETFQPTAGPVSWRGWRLVSMPLDGSQAGSWGGDGKVDGRIRWDALFLVDSTREGGAGTIDFACPVVELSREVP
jgi:hypothetical protein